MSWSFAGPLGSMLSVRMDERVSDADDLVTQATVTLSTRDGDAPGMLSESMVMPAGATPEQVATGLHAIAMRLLAHEALESMRLDGARVFDAHPTVAEVANVPAFTGALSPAASVWTGP